VALVELIFLLSLACYCCELERSLILGLMKVIMSIDEPEVKEVVVVAEGRFHQPMCLFLSPPVFNCLILSLRNFSFSPSLSHSTRLLLLNIFFFFSIPSLRLLFFHISVPY
jgi:hypothetical protein